MDLHLNDRVELKKASLRLQNRRDHPCGDGHQMALRRLRAGDHAAAQQSRKKASNAFWKEMQGNEFLLSRRLAHLLPYVPASSRKKLVYQAEYK